MIPCHHCHPRVDVFGASLLLSASRFSTFSCWCFLLPCISVSLPSVTRATLCVPPARARPQVFLIPAKAASVKRLYAVLGKGTLPCWCFIVVHHGGNVQRSFYCLLLLRRVAAHISPLFRKHVFQGLADWNPVYIQSETSFPWGSQVLCGTIATMFSQVPRRDSQDLYCFSVVVVSSRW